MKRLFILFVFALASLALASSALAQEKAFTLRVEFYPEKGELRFVPVLPVDAPPMVFRGNFASEWQLITDETEKALAKKMQGDYTVSEVGRFECRAECVPVARIIAVTVDQPSSDQTTQASPQGQALLKETKQVADKLYFVISLMAGIGNTPVYPDGTGNSQHAKFEVEFRTSLFSDRLRLRGKSSINFASTFDDGDAARYIGRADVVVKRFGHTEFFWRAEANDNYLLNNQPASNGGGRTPTSSINGQWTGPGISTQVDGFKLGLTFMNRIRGHQPLFFASNKRPLGQFQLQFEVEKYFKGFLLMVEPELTFGRDGASTGHLFMTGKVEKPIVKHLSVVSEWGYHHNYGLDRKQWGPYHLPLDPARGYIYFGIELPFGSRD